MDASKIREIIREKTKRYKAILVDGEWGIGNINEGIIKNIIYKNRKNNFTKC